VSRIIIDGPIGPGKFTLLEVLGQNFPLYPEPVDTWSLLAPYYTDQTPYGFALQLQILTSLLTRPANITYLAERHPYSGKDVFSRFLAQSEKEV
jgi:deoxyadenosine/deoxycytidine kinase